MMAISGRQAANFTSTFPSTSGTVTAIEQHTVAHPSGLDDLCVILTPDGEDAWGERNPQPDYWNLERGELLDRIQHFLEHHYDISHATVQMEYQPCNGPDCHLNEAQSGHSHQHHH